MNWSCSDQETWSCCKNRMECEVPAVSGANSGANNTASATRSRLGLCWQLSRCYMCSACVQIEQCQCINARAMKKVADAASAPVYGSDRAGMTFSWWATAHSFQHRSGGMGRTRRLQAAPAAVAPSPESLKLISEAVDSEDVPTAGTPKSASSIDASHVRSSPPCMLVFQC